MNVVWDKLMHILMSFDESVRVKDIKGKGEKRKESNKREKKSKTKGGRYGGIECGTYLDLA